MSEGSKKRGRPTENGGKKKDVHFRVGDDFYNELAELSKIEGVSMTEYVMSSVKFYGNLTRIRKKESAGDDNFDE